MTRDENICNFVIRVRALKLTSFCSSLYLDNVTLLFLDIRHKTLPTYFPIPVDASFSCHVFRETALLHSEVHVKGDTGIFDNYVTQVARPKNVSALSVSSLEHERCWVFSFNVFCFSFTFSFHFFFLNFLAGLIFIRYDSGDFRVTQSPSNKFEAMHTRVSTCTMHDCI